MEETIKRIYKSSLKFLTPLSSNETYQVVTEEAMRLVNADAGSIFLMLDGELRRVYTSDPRFYQIIPRPNGITYQVYRTKESKILSIEEVAKIHPEIENTSISADIIVPLYYKKESIGVLTVQSSKKSSFNSNDLHILTLFSALATLAIHKTQMYDEVREALELRDVFISMASHELRTPLTSISGYIQLLYGKLGKGDSAEARWIRELYREGNRMTHLVKELLEINRIKSGQFQYRWEECHLRQIVGEAVKDFQFTYPERRIVFDDNLCGQTDSVIGDHGKLLQVIDNLTANAVKFSNEDSSITLRLSAKNQDLVLSVQDQGKGIKKEDLPRIFEGFYRGKNHNKEGLGLGLYLVKDIIEHHKGMVRVRSRLNKGTTIEVRFHKTD